MPTSAQGSVARCLVLGAGCGEGMQGRAWRVAGLCTPYARRVSCHAFLTFEGVLRKGSCGRAIEKAVGIGDTILTLTLTLT